MHVLLLEAELIGHHPVYLRAIAQLHLEMGRQVTAVVSEKYVSHPLLTDLAQRYEAEFYIETISEARCAAAQSSALGKIGRELHFWRIFRQAYLDVAKRREVDYVFLPYMDYCLYALGLRGSPFGGAKWGGICMRPSFHFSAVGVVAPRSLSSHYKEILFKRVLRQRTLTRMLTIDPTLSGYFQGAHADQASKLCYLPDPTEPCEKYPRLDARRSLGLDPDVTVILAYGALDSRKGIDRLLDGMLHQDAPRGIHLLLVGEQSAEVKSLLMAEKATDLRREGRLHQLDEFVNIERERQAFSASDIVWLGYGGHYTMSGVLVKAVQYGLTVLGINQGLIGWYIGRENLGVAVEVENAAEVARGLEWCVLHHPFSEARQRCWQEKYSWREASKMLVLVCD